MEENVEKLIQLICDKSGKTKEDIESLINSKVDEFSGLVTKEGAAHIIANDLGVKMETNIPDREFKFVKLDEIKDEVRNISFICKVIKKYPLVEFNSKTSDSKGQVQSLLVGDEKDIIRVTFWNSETSILENINEEDILEIKNTNSKKNQNMDRYDIHYNQYSDLSVNPEGIEITLKKFEPKEIEFTEKKINEIEDNNRNVKIIGRIVDFEIPRFYLADPKTFKKVLQENGKFLSPVTNEEIEPIKVPIVNIRVDDGSGSIQVVAFRERAEEIMKEKSENITKLGENTEDFNLFTKKLVGAKVELGGNVSVREMSGDKQFLINQVLNIEHNEVSTDKLAEEIVKENETKSDDDDLDIDDIDLDDDIV